MAKLRKLENYSPAFGRDAHHNWDHPWREIDMEYTTKHEYFYVRVPDETLDFRPVEKEVLDWIEKIDIGSNQQVLVIKGDSEREVIIRMERYYAEWLHRDNVQRKVDMPTPALKLDWKFDDDGWPEWRALVSPFFILVGQHQSSPRRWYWDLNVNSDAGESTIDTSGETYKTSDEARCAAEQHFAEMVSEWPSIELEK